MIKLTVTKEDGTNKTYAAGPITMGLQKALARYGREAGKAALKAIKLQNSNIDFESDEGMAAIDEVTETMDHMSEMQEEIVLRAFGGQITPDELDEVPVAEIARVIQELQANSYGVVRKNG